MGRVPLFSKDTLLVGDYIIDFSRLRAPALVPQVSQIVTDVGDDRFGVRGRDSPDSSYYGSYTYDSINDMASLAIGNRAGKLEVVAASIGFDEVLNDIDVLKSSSNAGYSVCDPEDFTGVIDSGGVHGRPAIE